MVNELTKVEVSLWWMISVSVGINSNAKFRLSIPCLPRRCLAMPTPQQVSINRYLNSVQNMKRSSFNSHIGGS